MKKKLFLIVALVLCALGSAFAQTNITIAVPAPKTMNIGDGNEWIPLFIQGVITSNFQQYSGMKVVDRQNADMVKAEQRLSEGAEFDEKTAIELGKMTSARLIITGNITGKSSSYALMFSITDVETGETKASATVPNCLFSALENGEAANRISYDLMTGYGVKLSADAKAKLTTASGVMSAETTAQASVARGIVAEKNGSNIEALTYYIQAKKNDKNFSEATSRASAMSTAVASGNFGAKAKNLIKMRNDWDKLLTEAAELIKSNPPTFELLYYSDVTPGEIDYDKGRMVLSVSAPLLRQNNEKATQENLKLVNELKDALAKIPERKDWGEKINNFPWKYYKNYSGWYTFDINFLNADKKKIGTERVWFEVDYGWYDYAFNVYERRYEWNLYTERHPSRYSNEVDDSGVINIYVDVNDADTDTIYVSVDSDEDYGITITPVKTNAMGYTRACSVIKSGDHNGMLKIAGYAYDLEELFLSLDRSRKPVSIDLSELEIDPSRFHTRRRRPGDPEIIGWIPNLKGIILPDNLSTIPAKAFENCTALESITIPASVTEIGDEAFKNCTSLKTLTILAPVTDAWHTFRGCKFDTVNFYGTKDDWKRLGLNIKAKKMNYNYKGK